MKRLFLFTLLGLILVLAGCVATQAVVMEKPADTIDLTQLADEIDPGTVAALQEQDDVFIFDVREQEEYDQGHIPGIALIPMDEVPDRLSEIPTDKTVIVTCRSGNRSGQVAEFLREQGYKRVHNMKGGIVAWEKAGYPVEN
jgi:rhodanese-related sulfurtransferase